MASTTLKILTVGSALGSIHELFGKIKTINAKHGKFDLVLCVGDFFGGESPNNEEGSAGDLSQLLSGQLQGRARPSAGSHREVREDGRGDMHECISSEQVGHSDHRGGPAHRMPRWSIQPCCL
ncbi:hypothetical protein BV25DRAFT_284021 [Artomyces pyxidatus]|uniref:Uncharacterized protein n=1 Tax=Artomyces pyxidatus TaxID=48021 RepID=A0ACB8T766_9AGAM|nr:hypothetical protein BV25DRAFT_284021 [Artomyces pyxidatus]